MNKNQIKQIGLPVGIALIAGLVVYFILHFTMVAPLKNQLKKTSSENSTLTVSLTKANEELEASNKNLSSVTTELTGTKDELSLLKTDVNAKQAQIDKITAETEAVKKDLKTQQASLDKAKTGIAKLKDLDALFLKYDSQSEELSNVLVKYSAAIDNDSYADIDFYSNRFDAISTEIEATYTKITNLLTEFRNGKY